MSGIEHDIPDLGVTITNDLQTTRVVVEKDPYLGVDVANDLQTKRVIVRQQSYIINQNSIPIPEGIAISAVSSSYAQTASLANLAVTASFALSNAGTVQNATSASYATTASYVSGAASTWDDISNKPEGLVSSSTQIINYNLLATTGSNIFTGTQIAPSFSGSLFGTASWAQYAVTASYVEGPAGITDWSEITNKPDGLVSSSAQINTGSFSGSFIGDGSGLTNIASTLTFSGSTGGDVLNLKTETLNILGSNGITTSITDNTVTVNLPAGTVTASSQIDYTQIQNKPTTIATASYVEFVNVANKPTLVSSSAQINTGSFSGSFTGTLIGTSSWATNAISSSFASSTSNATSASYVEYSNVANKPTLVSASSQVDVTQTTNIATIATTGSNTFTGIQNISNTTNSTNYTDGALVVTGGVGIGKDVNISGSLNVIGLLTAISMSTQYVTSSQYTVGTSRIILNDDDLVRFAGISVIDSGSTYGTGSLLWDSLNNRWIYEADDLAYNSAILIAGPKNTGTLGNEVGLISGRIPVATGDDHIDTALASSSLYIDFADRKTYVEAGLYVTGSITASNNISGTLIGTASFATTSSFATTTGNVIGTSQSIALFNSSNTISSSVIFQSGSNIGVNTNNPQARFHINDTASAVGTQLLITNDSTRTGIRFGSSSLAAGKQHDIYHRTDQATAEWIIGTVGGETAQWRFQPQDNSAFSVKITVPRNPGGTARILSDVTHSFSIGANNVTDIIWVTGSGNVGIGTTVPGNNRLQVQGNISASSYTSSISNAVGFLGTSSWAQSSSVAVSSSFAVTSSYVLPTGLPVGIVSSSAQINTGSFTGSFFGTFSGSVFGTSSWATNAISSSFATTASAATSITFIPATSSYAVSSSFAETSSVTLKVRILSGSVGSGLAQYTGSFSGSFYGDGTNLAGVNTITISGSAPTPKTGSLWYDNTTGKTYIYYVSASQGQWVLQSDPTYDIGAVVEAATASVALTIPNTAPATPLTGSIYFSGAWLYVYNGVKYVSASLN